MVAMVIDIAGRDVVSDEAILKDGKTVGYVSSGGYAHHVRKSIALGYIPSPLYTHGTALEVEINGKLHPAAVIAYPLYDANGSRMRS